jgi:hypothetical protein
MTSDLPVRGKQGKGWVGKAPPDKSMMGLERLLKPLILFVESFQSPGFNDR